MSFDELKEFNGQTYTGMPVGGHHVWNYTNAVWRERKVAPDRWELAFTSIKRRDRSAPVGAGVPLGTQYHWYILAHQWVRKIDGDSYTTFLSGLKYKLGHKRPSWRRWSHDYADQEPERERVISILEEAIIRLRGSPRSNEWFSVAGLGEPITPRESRRSARNRTAR